MSLVFWRFVLQFNLLLTVGYSFYRAVHYSCLSHRYRPKFETSAPLSDGTVTNTVNNALLPETYHRCTFCSTCYSYSSILLSYLSQLFETRREVIVLFLGSVEPRSIQLGGRWEALCGHVRPCDVQLRCSSTMCNSGSGTAEVESRAVS